MSESRIIIRESLRFFKEKKRESSTYGIAFQAKFCIIGTSSRDFVTGYSRFAR
jgi:hypothetical protein